MSQSQEVRVLMRPPLWSALPLFGSDTKSRMRVPAVRPKTGDTYNDTTESEFSSHSIPETVGDSSDAGQRMCVYKLYGQPLCLPLRLTSYTSPLKPGACPSAFSLLYRRQGETLMSSPLLFFSLCTFMLHVFACESERGRETKGRRGLCGRGFA